MRKPPRPFIEKRHRLWCVLDLITDPKTGKIRETLLWSNLGKAAALVGFIWKIHQGTDTEALWMIVMGVLTAHAIISQYLANKLGVTVGSTTEASVQVTKTRTVK